MNKGNKMTMKKYTHNVHDKCHNTLTRHLIINECQNRGAAQDQDRNESTHEMKSELGAIAFTYGIIKIIATLNAFSLECTLYLEIR